MTLREQLPCRECGHAALYHGADGCTMVMPEAAPGVRTRWMCECREAGSDSRAGSGESAGGGGDD